MRRVKVLFGSQHGREIPRPEIILQDREAKRSIRCSDALPKIVDLLPPLQKARQAVLNLLLRSQYRVLVIDQKGLQRGVLDSDLIGDLPVIENIPGKRRAERKGNAPPLEDPLELVLDKPALGDIGGSRAKSPGQAERRIEVRLGDADLCALRHRRQLGSADIRPAADEIGGNADSDGLWRDRDAT